MIDVEEARKVGDAATVGSWRASTRPDGVHVVDLVDYRGDRVSHIADCDSSESDARFITYAHNHWPALLDEIEQLREELDAMRAKTDCSVRRMD